MRVHGRARREVHMSPIEQLEAELRTTRALRDAETDSAKRAVLDGECEAIEASIAHERALADIARRHAWAHEPVRLVRR